MKYRKKPVVVEAFRLGMENIPDWFMNEFNKGNIKQVGDDPEDFYCEIPTLEGTMKANYGDYVIKGVNGEIYPCKPDIFAKTYEKVE